MLEAASQNALIRSDRQDDATVKQVDEYKKGSLWIALRKREIEISKFSCLQKDINCNNKDNAAYKSSF